MREAARMDVAFLGSKSLGLGVLAQIVATFPTAHIYVLHPEDSADSRSRLGSFHEYIEGTSIELEIVHGPQESQQRLDAIRPRIVVVCGWYWMLGTDALATAELGFFGIHPSLLPKYRGNAPLVWQVLRGESQIGATLFKLEAGMDDGLIYHQWRFPLGNDDWIGDVLVTLEERITKDIGRVLRDIVDGHIVGYPQDEAKATYCAVRMPADGRIDWSARSSDVYNFVRAQADPYPGAFFLLNDTKVFVDACRPSSLIAHGPPGRVLLRGGDEATVCCGENSALVLSVLRQEGQGRVPASSLVRSLRTSL